MWCWRQHSHTQTHPLPNAVVVTNIDNLDFLPENAFRAPAPDLLASLDRKHEQDDEGNKHQKAHNHSDGLQEPQPIS